MNAITYTTARENLAKTIEKVVSDRDPVIITKKKDVSAIGPGGLPTSIGWFTSLLTGQF